MRGKSIFRSVVGVEKATVEDVWFEGTRATGRWRWSASRCGSGNVHGAGVSSAVSRL